jgi:hypothetical protein
VDPEIDFLGEKVFSMVQDCKANLTISHFELIRMYIRILSKVRREYSGSVY